MEISRATWSEIQKVLQHTHSIWSKGMTGSDYQEYIWWQINHPWSKKNMDYIVLKSSSLSDEVLSSLKLYRFDFKYGHQNYKLAGVGAVFTPSHCRNKGFCQELLYQLIENCKNENLDGLFLFSDIKTSFYEKFGFIDIGNISFSMKLDETFLQSKEFKTLFSSIENYEGELDFEILTSTDIDYLERHYRRWQDLVPTSMTRSNLYWQYQIEKHKTLDRLMGASWLPLRLVRFRSVKVDGYALIVIDKKTVKIIELIGSSINSQILLKSLIIEMLKLGCEKIEGWSQIVHFLEPLHESNVIEEAEQYKIEPINRMILVNRSTKRGMILPIKNKVANWHTKTNSISSLDHF